jgi:hypothetical protein
MASVQTRLMPGKKRAPQLLADSTLMRCALDRLGQSMLAPTMAPRPEFRQSLRAELVAQAALPVAAVRPSVRPSKVKSRGGFRLAALGIGISAAGGGFALAANRVSPPEPLQAPATQSAPSATDHTTTSPSSAGVHGAPGVTAPRTPTTVTYSGAGHPAGALRQTLSRSAITGLCRLAPLTTDTPLPNVSAESIARPFASPGANPPPTAPSRALPDAGALYASAGAHWAWPTPPPGRRP